MVKLCSEIADLKRNSAERFEEDETTIDTAKIVDRSFVDFVNDPNMARSQGALAVRAC